MPPILIIFNPAAHSEKAHALLRKIEQLPGGAQIRLTTAPGEARAIAESAVRKGVTRIVAAGGDGTINEVVNGIAHSDVSLGLLPIGTMNVFAAELGLPLNSLRKCWDIIERGETRLVDLPRANRHQFVQLGGVGFDAQIVAATSFDSKKTFGPLSYLLSATQIASQKPPRLVIESPAHNCKGSFVLIGNGRYYGGPFVIFKEALIDDGMLDVLVFKNLGYLDIVRYLQAIIFGTHTRLKDVEYFQTKKVSIHSEDDVPVEVDGEVIGKLPVTFRIEPHGLKVFAPRPK